MTLTSYLGDTNTFNIPLRSGNQPFVPGARWGLLFTVKSDRALADDQSLIQKRSEPAMGIVVTGSNAAVTILRADSFREAGYPQLDDPAYAAEAGTYCWDIRATDSENNNTKTVASGSIVFFAPVGKKNVSNVTIYTTDAPYPGGLSTIISDGTPPNPTNGMLWLDSSDNVLSVWDAAAFTWVSQQEVTMIQDNEPGTVLTLTDGTILTLIDGTILKL